MGGVISTVKSFIKAVMKTIVSAVVVGTAYITLTIVSSLGDGVSKTLTHCQELTTIPDIVAMDAFVEHHKRIKPHDSTYLYYPQEYAGSWTPATVALTRSFNKEERYRRWHTYAWTRTSHDAFVREFNVWKFNSLWAHMDQGFPCKIPKWSFKFNQFGKGIEAEEPGAYALNAAPTPRQQQVMDYLLRQHEQNPQHRHSCLLHGTRGSGKSAMAFFVARQWMVNQMNLPAMDRRGFVLIDGVNLMQDGFSVSHITAMRSNEQDLLIINIPEMDIAMATATDGRLVGQQMGNSPAQTKISLNDFLDKLTDLKNCLVLYSTNVPLNQLQVQPEYDFATFGRVPRIQSTALFQDRLPENVLLPQQAV